MALLSGGSKLFFAAAATALMALAAALLVTSAHRWATAALRGQELLHQTLECIGLVTIAIAVFEVGKFIVEEELVRERQLRSVLEARRSLTKFLTIVVITVSLEGLVLVFETKLEQLSDLIYPTALLLVPRSPWWRWAYSSASAAPASATGSGPTPRAPAPGRSRSGPRRPAAGAARQHQVVDQPPVFTALGHPIGEPQDRAWMLGHQQPPAVRQGPQPTTLQCEADRAAEQFGGGIRTQRHHQPRRVTLRYQGVRRTPADVVHSCGSCAPRPESASARSSRRAVASPLQAAGDQNDGSCPSPGRLRSRHCRNHVGKAEAVLHRHRSLQPSGNLCSCFVLSKPERDATTKKGPATLVAGPSSAM